MPTDSIADRLAEKAAFVFTGTVHRLNAATMPELAVNARTAIVLVEEILQAPAAFSSFAGREITVQVGGRKKIAVGDRVVFYANSWRFGEGIAVQAIDYLPAQAPSSRPRAMVMAAAAPHGLTPARSSPAEALARRKLQQRVDKADLVVTGRVKAVRAPSEPSPAPKSRSLSLQAAAAPVAQRPQRISEHDPLWREAVVEVTGTEKGGATSKEIVVRFPSSRDVRWYKAPKFEPGQEGMFLLQKSKSAGAAPGPGKALTAARAASRDAEVFTADHSADFQPMHLAETVRTLIRPSDKPEPKPVSPRQAKARPRRN